jgi:hypothetical protein
MYSVEADRKHNRLYLDLTGRVEKEELRRVADEVVAKAEQLDDGYDIVNDLTGFTPPTRDAVDPIKKIQRQLRYRGLNRTVRVLDEETDRVVAAALERRARDVGYSGETVGSVTEAERRLEEAETAGYTDF